MVYKNKRFTEGELRGNDFERDTFISCKFVNINLKFVGFVSCKFKLCDFSGSMLNLVRFVDCTFAESKLSNLDFADTQIKACDFSGAIMKNCIFQQLKEGKKDRRKKLDLTDCKFSETKLERSVFVLCDLTKVGFNGSSLEGVVFEKCDLVGTDFTGADIEGASFTTSKIEKAKLDMEGYIAFGNSKGFILK